MDIVDDMRWQRRSSAMHINGHRLKILESFFSKKEKKTIGPTF